MADKSVLDELESGNSVLDELDKLEMPVTPTTEQATPLTPSTSSPIPGASVLDEVEQQKASLPGINEDPSLGDLAGKVYEKVGRWAGQPNSITEASPLRFTENLAKGAVGLGMGIGELVKLELGGLGQWFSKPKESFASLKQGPSLLKEAVVLPMLEDVKDVITHPIRYTYEKPVAQILNVAMVTGFGAAAKSARTTSQVSRAAAFMDEGVKLAQAGDIVGAQVAKEAALGTMNKLPKSGLRLLNPKMDELVENIRYQDWLETYSPMTSRGVAGGVTRGVKTISKREQLGPVAKFVKEEPKQPLQPQAGGMMHEFPDKLASKGIVVVDRGDMFRLPDDIKVTDIYGNKVTLNKGHEFTEYHLSNNQIWLHDGKSIVVNKNQLQNVKNQSLVLGEKNIFSPEEMELTTIIKKGPSGRFDGEAIGPKFSEYVVPGGKNYREILFQAPVKEGKIKTPREALGGEPKVKDLGEGELVYTYPYEKTTIHKIDNKYVTSLGTYDEAEFSSLEAAEKDLAKNFSIDDRPVDLTTPGYKSPHWDEPNIVAHARVTDRVGPDGKKVMFIEEIQSDWAKSERTNLSTEGNIPGHPLLKDWQELTLKKLVKQAIDEGYDGISWATGEQTAAHYSLAKKIDSLAFIQDAETVGKGNVHLRGYKGKNEVVNKTVKLDELERYVPKDVAEKIRKNEGLKDSGMWRRLEGQDLEIGGQWAKNLYDKQLPSLLKKITKSDIQKGGFKVKPGKSVKAFLNTEEVKRVEADFDAPIVIDKGEIKLIDPDTDMPTSFREYRAMARKFDDDNALQIADQLQDLDNTYQTWLKEQPTKLEQDYLPLTKEVKARIVGDQPSAGSMGVKVPPKNPPTAVSPGPNELPPEGGEKHIHDLIREHAFGNAASASIKPEGMLDAQNYERWLMDNAAGKVPKVVIKPEYQGDYYSLKSVTGQLKKAPGETKNSSTLLFNHWMDNLQGMKHPEHGQTFTAKTYKAEGDIPKMPERIYPWIKIKEKGPMPNSEISKVAGIIKSPGQNMRDAWGLNNPLVDAFEAQQSASLNINNGFTWFNKLSRGIKPEIESVKKAMGPYLNNHLRLQNKLAIITDPALREAVGKEVAANYKAAYDMQMKLAESMPDVRVQLYAADQLPANLVKTMTEKELKIGEMVKAYYAQAGKDMQRVGLPTINGKAYVRHLIADEMVNANGDWSKIPEYIKANMPRDMAFAHRTGEFDWYPSLVGAMNNYIPIVEKKLAMQPYLIHWRDTITQAANLGNRAAQNALDMITKNMYKTTSVSNKISNGITSTNYFLQLFGNARVAVKHIIGGFPGSISEVGFWTAPEALYTMVRYPLKSQELLKTFNRLEDAVKTLEMTTGMDYHANRFLKALQGQPTAAAEYLESGINILGNLIKGGNKNIDPELLRQYIWNKVTSVNFRGGWDIPRAFANPAGRVAFQYSLEPHKVWEYRFELVKRALAGEKDIYGTPYGSKLVNYIMLTGAMEMMARSQGKTIIDTIGGTPYVDFISPKKDAPGFKTTQPKVKFGPGVKMLRDVSISASQGDFINVLDYFIDYGLESGVGIIHQLMVAGAGKTPDYYKDSISYLLGLPEVAELERRNAKTARYLKFRSEKEELFHESKIMKKNPMLKHLILYKRAFRKQLRDFIHDPDKHINALYGNTEQTSVLDELEATNE